MKTLMLAVEMMLIAGCLVTGCGDDSDSKEPTPVEACTQVVGVLCDKIFDCYTQAELSAASSVVGLNSSDCKTKLGAARCSTTMTMCAAGQTYKAGNADQCVEGYRSFNCDDIKGNFAGTTPDPAICDQICVRE